MYVSGAVSDAMSDPYRRARRVAFSELLQKPASIAARVTSISAGVVESPVLGAHRILPTDRRAELRRVLGASTDAALGTRRATDLLFTP